MQYGVSSLHVQSNSTKSWHVGLTNLIYMRFICVLQMTKLSNHISLFCYASTRATENRTRWREIVAKSSMVFNDLAKSRECNKTSVNHACKLFIILKCLIQRLTFTLCSAQRVYT